MQYDVTNPEEYLICLKTTMEDKLPEVRRLILSTARVEEISSIKMPLTVLNKDVFGLNAQKGDVSLYAGDISKIPNASALLNRSYWKGCIRSGSSLTFRKNGLKSLFVRL